MTALRAEFLPAVVRHPQFAAMGLLRGRERLPRMWLDWTVIDPRRHTMYMWRKRSPSLTRSATGLGASVFTNGPFTDYPAGGLRRTLVRYGADVTKTGLAAAADSGRREHWRDEIAAVKLRQIQAPAPLGHVIGAREGILETVVSRPRVHWFGRSSGHDFDSYRIGAGDPPDLEEGLGGLFRSVRDYTPYTVDQTIRVGYWALAPLASNPRLCQAGIEDAISQYADASGQLADASRCTGVVLVVAGWANTQRLSHLLSAAQVKDAVQFDGGDSLLLGHDRSITIGAMMPPWKRVLQRWGVQFQPITSVTPTAPVPRAEGSQ